MSPVTTRQQKMAQAAFAAVSSRTVSKEYVSFAKSFPALIQAAGLCQAAAFANAKGKGTGPQSQVLDDVIATHDAVVSRRHAGHREFLEATRNLPVMEYMRLTRLTLQAATWVKRYVEVLEADTPIVAPEDALTP